MTRLTSTVRATLQPEVVTFDAEGHARVMVDLSINDGFHINAHEPGDEQLIGLDVRLVGAQGLVAEVGYPEGDLYRESIRVHAREISIPVELVRTGEVSGQPVLVVRWQACTDQVCHAPQSAQLPVRISASAP